MTFGLGALQTLEFKESLVHYECLLSIKYHYINSWGKYHMMINVIVYKNLEKLNIPFDETTIRKEKEILIADAREKSRLNPLAYLCPLCKFNRIDVFPESPDFPKEPHCKSCQHKLIEEADAIKIQIKRHKEYLEGNFNKSTKES